MSRFTRRSFIGAALAGTASTLLSEQASAWEGSPGSSHRQYIVNVFLWGGLDGVLTVDPRDSTVAGNRIEAGYGPEERLQGSHRLYGPLMGELIRHDAELCLVHGVRTDTVAHPLGQRFVQRGRVAASAHAPWLGDLLGASLPGDAPIAHLALGQSPEDFGAEEEHSPAILSVELAQSLIDPRARSARVGSWLRSSDTARDDALAGLVSTAEHEPRFQDPVLGPQLQLALHALKGNFAKAITVSTRPLHLDAHRDHLELQRRRLVPALDDVARFIDALKSTHNERGSLFEQTTLVLGSEFGRAPTYNASGGKEHWPQGSWVLAGNGIRGGVTVGKTGPDLRGLSIDYRTGLPTGDQRRPVLIDALSATLLQIASPGSSLSGLRLEDALPCALAERSSAWRRAIS